MPSIAPWIGNAVFVASFLPNAYGFWRARKKTKETQQQLLAAIVKKNMHTAFGREHRFFRIRSVADFRKYVPLRSYDDYMPYIAMLREGVLRVCTEEEPLYLEPTSGSSAPSKFIPYTKGLKKDFSRGIDPWLFSLYCRVPALLGGCQYWSITPSLADYRDAESAVPIGFAEDAEYFGWVQRRIVESIQAVPAVVKKIKDPEAFRLATLLFLAARRDLRLISVWHPTYLSLLFANFFEHIRMVCSCFAKGDFPYPLPRDIRRELGMRLHIAAVRLKELLGIMHLWDGKDPHAVNEKGQTMFEAVWPELRVVSSWQEGTAASDLQEIKRMFPHALFQPKGLLATEGCVSFPFFQHESLLSVRSHFFEFAEVKNDVTCYDTPVLADELERGKQYAVIITTQGGLYRYCLHDVIEVTAFWESIPCIRFAGRDDLVVDCVGEKLNERHVERAGEYIFALHCLNPSFWMLAPERFEYGYRYVLFAEGIELNRRDSFQVELDRLLSENFHYAYARKLGQLQAPDICIISAGKGKNALARFYEVSYRLGRQLGTIKISRLHGYEQWRGEFNKPVV